MPRHNALNSVGSIQDNVYVTVGSHLQIPHTSNTFKQNLLMRYLLAVHDQAH